MQVSVKSPHIEVSFILDEPRRLSKDLPDVKSDNVVTVESITANEHISSYVPVEKDNNAFYEFDGTKLVEVFNCPDMKYFDYLPIPDLVSKRVSGYIKLTGERGLIAFLSKGCGDIPFEILKPQYIQLLQKKIDGMTSAMGSGSESESTTKTNHLLFLDDKEKHKILFRFITTFLCYKPQYISRVLYSARSLSFLDLVSAGLVFDFNVDQGYKFLLDDKYKLGAWIIRKSSKSSTSSDFTIWSIQVYDAVTQRNTKMIDSKRFVTLHNIGTYIVSDTDTRLTPSIDDPYQSYYMPNNIVDKGKKDDFLKAIKYQPPQVPFISNLFVYMHNQRIARLENLIVPEGTKKSYYMGILQAIELEFVNLDKSQ